MALDDRPNLARGRRAGALLLASPAVPAQPHHASLAAAGTRMAQGIRTTGGRPVRSGARA